MKPGLSLRVSQHLSLTPQLQQSIQLLQLSTLELAQEVEQMLGDNPFLELANEEGDHEAAAGTREPAATGAEATEYLLAHATLSRPQGRNERISTVRVLALEMPGGDTTATAARHVVTLQVTQLKAGVVAQVDDSTLTPLPQALEPARQRALAYLRQRLGAGDVLQSHEGFAELDAEAGPAPSPGQAPGQATVPPGLPE